MTTPAVSLRSLLTLAWPVVLARASQAVIGFTDALMVAPLGEAPLAAVTTGALNMFTFFIFPMGVVFIVQSFAAQLRGKGDLTALPRYAWYGLSIAGAAGLLAALAIVAMPGALGLFHYAPEVEARMADYLQFRMWSVAAAVGTEALGNWYGGLGNTRPAMQANVIAMVVNVALNYALIEPRFGLPGYGVIGAAVASSIASWMAFATLATMFARGLGFSGGAAPRGLRRNELLRVLRFGLPNGVNWFLEFAAFALFINVVVGHLGTTALAAFNVVMQLNSVSFMPAFGLASAGAILVGEAIGRGAHDTVPSIVKLTGKVGALWMVSVGVLYMLWPEPLIGLFIPSGSHAGATDLLPVGTTMLMLSAIWQLFDAAGITLSEALRAAGDTRWCMFARIALSWFVFTPVAWSAVLWFDGGVVAVMVSVLGYLLLLAAAFLWRFRSGRWREIDLVGSEPTLV